MGLLHLCPAQGQVSPLHRHSDWQGTQRHHRYKIWMAYRNYVLNSAHTAHTYCGASVLCIKFVVSSISIRMTTVRNKTHSCSQALWGSRERILWSSTRILPGITSSSNCGPQSFARMMTGMNSCPSWSLSWWILRGSRCSCLLADTSVDTTWYVSKLIHTIVMSVMD